jgi:hypothetical protein
MTDNTKTKRRRRKSAIDRSAYLPYDEALKWSRTLGLANQKEWKDFCSAGKCPKNIPQRPNKVYKEWINFAVWLGTQERKLEKIATRAAELIAIIYLYTLSTRAGNVIYVGTATGTDDELARIEIPSADGRIEIIRAFVLEPGAEDFVKIQIARHVAGGVHPTELYEKPFVINNLASLLFELDMVLLPFQFKRGL